MGVILGWRYPRSRPTFSTHSKWTWSASIEEGCSWCLGLPYMTTIVHWSCSFTLEIRSPQEWISLATVFLPWEDNQQTVYPTNEDLDIVSSLWCIFLFNFLILYSTLVSWLFYITLLHVQSIIAYIILYNLLLNCILF